MPTSAAPSRAIRFLGALMVSNFVVVPLLVALLVQFLPPDPMVRLGVLFVLLTPCIDYVVTFSHIGRADARLLLASTPALLIAQMLLLSVYLGVFLGDASADLVQLGPFVHAFVWLIAVPLASAAVVQVWAARSKAGRAVAFSSATRNSLVVLPLALAVPGAIPLLPAIIVTQTMVELVASVIYMQLVPKLGKAPSTCS